MLRLNKINSSSVVARTPADVEQVSARDLHIEALIGPKFDAEFYAEEYQDLESEPNLLLRHFCQRGWKEGRNPNADFDTVSYLLMHSDVGESGINPFFHFLLRGQEEGRTALSAAIPSKIAEEALGQNPGDWVKLIRPFVDEAYYTACLKPAFDGSFDPVAHFAYCGWLAGYNPNPSFDVNSVLLEQPKLRALRMNPLLWTIATTQLSSAPPSHTASTVIKNDTVPLFASKDVLSDHVLQEVAKHLDVTYYSAMYPNAISQYGDAVAHYCSLGWTEGKNPTNWFDTSYYLEANSDVAGQGINPFWHYLVAGMAEGRRPKRPGGYRRQVIDSAIDPDEITKFYVIPKITKVLSRIQLEKRLRAATKTRGGLALSIGHDRYTIVTGGIQLFIADEQARFVEQNIGYLNISPVRPLLRLADSGDTDLMLNLILDGSFLGAAGYDTLTEVIGRILPPKGKQKLFLVHSLFGHNIEKVIALQRAFCSTADFFWVHDYSSVCVGYTLLRNDVAFCRAPPPDSMICRICVYGKRRSRHVAQLHQLFGEISFQVVAPSRAALKVWQEHANLPHQSAGVHPHCDLVFTKDPVLAGSKLTPIRIAFIGYPRAHKGWPLWQELVSRSWQRGVYQFFHFSASEAIQPSVMTEHHVVSTSPDDPDAMINALAEREIDLVLVLSTWPETFSYVTYEALASGADIVCLADSGNIADTVTLYSRGFVANTDAEVFAFFETEQAMDYVAISRAKGRQQARMIRNGTTATLIEIVTNI